ncbi:MAG: TIGR00725 family protein [Thermodesulfobacteriota bacterium]
MNLSKQHIIGVIGAGDASEVDCDLAQVVGEEIARLGFTLLCGAMGGVMEAACMGAKSLNGTTIGILPGTSKAECNPYIDYPIVTGMGHGRNIIVAGSSDAIIAIGGSYGTLSEIAFALRLKIPIIGINTWDVSPDIKKAQTPEMAVRMAIELINSSS